MAYENKKCMKIVGLVLEKLTNGTAVSPASPNPGPEEPSIYYDATETRGTTNSSINKASSTTGVASTPVVAAVQLRESKDNKEREATPSRPHSSHSKIPVPVKSPRCSLSESTPETNTQNTKTGTASELEKSPAQIVQQLKDRDTG